MNLKGANEFVFLQNCIYNIFLQRMSFLEALEKSGIVLEEPECIPHTHLNDPKRTWEPFVVQHTREAKLDELDLDFEPGKGLCWRFHIAI